MSLGPLDPIPITCSKRFYRKVLHQISATLLLFHWTHDLKNNNEHIRGWIIILYCERIILWNTLIHPLKKLLYVFFCGLSLEAVWLELAAWHSNILTFTVTKRCNLKNRTTPTEQKLKLNFSHKPLHAHTDFWGSSRGRTQWSRVPSRVCVESYSTSFFKVLQSNIQYNKMMHKFNAKCKCRQYNKD